MEANLKKRLVKSPKLYIRDSGLLHALLDIDKAYVVASVDSDYPLDGRVQVTRLNSMMQGILAGTI